MSIWRTYWHAICRPLDGFLWHKDISHPIIRSALRNQILASGAFILGGAALYAAFPWLFWFGAGILCMTWIFWSWARFFIRFPIKEYNGAFLHAVLLRFGLRLVLLAFLLYLALAWCAAPASAILAGLIAGACVALASYALNLKKYQGE